MVRLALFTLLVSTSVLLAASPDNFCFGQKPPGERPEIFAPRIISLEARLETYPAFSPDLVSLRHEERDPVLQVDPDRRDTQQPVSCVRPRATGSRQ